MVYPDYCLIDQETLESKYNPMDVIPGENPLRLRYIDFRDSRVSPKVIFRKLREGEQENIFFESMPDLTHIDELAKYYGYRTGTAELNFADLVDPGFTIEDIALRLAATRFFFTREKGIVKQFHDTTILYKGSERIDLSNIQLGGHIGRQYGNTTIVDEFSFKEIPRFRFITMRK